jgi:N-acetylglucosamine-6-sulfatase
VFKRPLPARKLLPLVLLALLGVAPPASAARPNVVAVMTDDQTVESLRVMPRVKRLLMDEGTTFDRSFVSFPVCCPSRATFLTGQYPHNHTVEGLDPPWGGYINLDTSSYLPGWLRRVGYNTIHLGKFLNGYGTQNLDPAEVPAGWTEWQGSVDPTTYRYYGYTLNENGVLRTYGEDEDPDFYQTDFYARRASELIERYAARPRPFFLSLNFVAPHHGGGVAEEEEESSLKLPVVAPRHRGAFAGEAPPGDPSYNEFDVTDKPAIIQRRPLLSPEQDTDIRRAYQRRLGSLLAVDEAVERIVNTLERSGELENTLIVFTSDNGFFHGEHRVPYGKLLPYEPSIRVPLIMRGPGVPRGQHRGQLVHNVDLAPTILDAANARGDAFLPADGLSLFRLLDDRGLEPGRDLLIAARGGAVRYWGLRTYRYLYVEYATGERELYDLDFDPFQEISVHGDSRYARIVRVLSRRLAALRVCEGRFCSTVPRVGLRVEPNSCARRAVRARLRGQDVQFLEEATFRVGRRLVARAQRRSRASNRRVPLRSVEPGKRFRLRVRVRLVDGRVVTLDRRLRACAIGQRRGNRPPASRRALP